MLRIDSNAVSGQEYKGQLVLPGEQEPRTLTAVFDLGSKSVKLCFDEPVNGRTEWQMASVSVIRREKFTEVAGMTRDLPRDGVPMAWRLNFSHLDNTAAGVVNARANEHRITGEKGFTLARPVKS